ncbi:hypothetical protein DY000_02041948 [Brassica cretica]|uniref:F-box associated beta-propeller type 1 domain-containing protein n=1 Tax=Brassica cretica TaxID=69181 RepID=A0ABQ7BRP2_BRACR|nr:hypothetical protein DY000_02041948 [Brassica cretica]
MAKKPPPQFHGKAPVHVLSTGAGKRMKAALKKMKLSLFPLSCPRLPWEIQNPSSSFGIEFTRETMMTSHLPADDALSLKDYNNSEVADIVTVIQCDGLLLCTTTEGELVVWNPCLGETRWIKYNDGRRCFRRKAMFTLRYENNQSCRCYKIMMFLDWYDIGGEYDQDGEFEIYDFNSNTWRFINARNCIFNKSEGVTLNGNTYWINIGYLLSFDFTGERFKRWYFPLTSQDYGDKKVALCDSPFTFWGKHERDVSGKSRSDTEMRHNDGQFSQEIGIMMSEADEWYWREIECTDFSSRRGSRRRRGWKTRCVTL